MNDPAMAVILLRLVPIGVGEAGRVVQAHPAGAVVEGNSVTLILREDASFDNGPVDRRHGRDIRPGDVIHWIGEPHRVIWVAQQPVAPWQQHSDQEVSP